MGRDRCRHSSDPLWYLWLRPTYSPLWLGSNTLSLLRWVCQSKDLVNMHSLIHSRHEIVGTAVKVGSKVEKGIK